MVVHEPTIKKPTSPKSIEEENENLLSVDTCGRIQQSEVDIVVNEYMYLHKDALIENSFCKDFKSVAYLRLFHHLLYCQIFQENKWEQFYKLIRCHQKISFENFVDDVPELAQPCTLVVPKECENTANTLVSIYKKYGTSCSERSRSIFDRHVKYYEGKYCLENNSAIKKIVILFDTIQHGSSTKGILDMYFDRGFHEDKICTFSYQGNPIFLEDISTTNGAPIEIIALYGSNEGIANVTDHVQKSLTVLRKPKVLEPIHSIDKKIDDCFINLAKVVYPDKRNSFKVGDYPIIREFNQPKKNVFPNELLKPENIASIFIRKKEL